MSEQNNKATVKTLASMLGLSISTVDRALNNRGNVKKATYERIMKAVQELNYTPNKSASLLSRNQSVKIAVVFQTYPAYFWEQIDSGVKKALDELADYGLTAEIVRTPNDSIQEQYKRIEEVIESGDYDGIAVSSDGSYEIGELIDKAVDSGMVACTFNTDSPESKRLFYVGCDYRLAGRLAAELLCTFVGRKGKIAFILETERMFQFHQKVLGFREVLSGHEQVQMVGPLRLKREMIQESLETIKEELMGVDGIYVASGQLGSVAKHLEQWGWNRALVGHDLDPDVYTFLQQGNITATICQEPHNQGYLAVKLLFERLTQQSRVNVPSLNESKLEVVMKENAKFYL
jgi:LacI family transcriptional regulator